ncbi:amidase [Karstenula rhodostoma CBS 690.94]|uniref:amidase n=1 Tax=Karstenula rhodostoma CBS 690.94 TaxID=1392251 RepID=A0A9P4P954_9PLEO|nr:amidase [Karstenula rhodostoma CBS 690.94]
MLPAPSSSKPLESWQSIAKRTQQHRDATIAAVRSPIPDIPDLPLDSTPIPKTILTPREVSITESDPVDLLSQLSSGSLSSEDVTHAFLRRAALAQKLTNCLTELLPQAALSRARYLDAYLAEHGKPLGPLHGLPISTKEMIHMASHTCNAAFIAWHARTPASNAHILDILLAAGAVLYARTTQPQTLMHLETSSNYFGATLNPFNRALTAGGSSGGEGALVGLRGSCLGIGTDIGGSIRSPAANCGVYGLRPTSGRLPMAGMSATMLSAEHIPAVVGPLSTSLGGVKVFARTLVDARPWTREPGLVPLPWKTESQFAALEGGAKKVRVGVLADDGVVRPHPPVRRALASMAEKLESVQGVDVVPFAPLDHDAAWTIISSLYFADGGAEEKAAIAASGEPWRPLSKFILEENKNVKALSVAEVWAWTAKRDAYRTAYAKHWEDSGIDVLLCPVGPGAAPALDTARYWGYTAQWNLLDYPALVAPVSKVLESDAADASYVPRNEDDRYNHGLYSPEKYANAPVSVQLVGRRYEDEKVIEAMEYIQEKLGLPWAEYV